MTEMESIYWQQYEELYYYWVLALYGGSWVYINLQRCVFPVVTRCRR